MTPLNTPIVPVVQGDREAAAGFVISRETEHKISNGLADSQPLVQAFARHRIASQAELLAVLELLVKVGSKATAYGLSVPGEPAFCMEQDSRQSAKEWLADPSNWLDGARAAIASARGGQ